MSRPGNVKFRRAIKAGRAIPPGRSMAEVDWDKAQEVLTGRHRPDDFDLGFATQLAQDEIQALKEEGRDSAARRVQRDLNSFDNARYAIRSSWCPTCINFLHNCQCEVEGRGGASTEFIDRITSQLSPTHSQLRKMKRLEKEGRQ